MLRQRVKAENVPFQSRCEEPRASRAPVPGRAEPSFASRATPVELPLRLSSSLLFFSGFRLEPRPGPGRVSRNTGDKKKEKAVGLAFSTAEDRARSDDGPPDQPKIRAEVSQNIDPNPVHPGDGPSNHFPALIVRRAPPHDGRACVTEPSFFPAVAGPAAVRSTR